MEPDEVMTLEDAANGLLSKEPEGQPETEEPDASAEVEEQETEASQEEPEAEDSQAEEIQDDGESEESSDAEEPDDDEDPIISLPDGSEEKWSDVVASRMRMKDYTQKTMALSEDRKTFESESANAREYLQQQYAQLQEQLATFAIADVSEPDWDSLEGKEYDIARRNYDKEMRQKSEAAEAYRQIQAQQQSEIRNREAQALLKAFPDWSDQTVFRKEAAELTELGATFDISHDEMAGIVDHRYIRILHRLKTLEAESSERKASAAKVAKRAIKAVKKPGTSPKPKEPNPEKARRQKRDALLKSKGHLSPQDAVAFIMEQ